MKKESEVKDISKYLYNIAMFSGILIVLLNLFYFIAFKDPFCNRNTAAGILTIIVTIYIKEKNSNK